MPPIPWQFIQRVSPITKERVRKRIHIDELALGMHVAELDRPWLGTPFPFQGFTLASERELAQLRELCEHVYIEVADESPPRGRPRLAVLPGSAGQRRAGERLYRASLEDELPTAAGMYRRARAHVERLFGEVRLGHCLDVEASREVVDTLLQSIIRNPDALLLLSTLHEVNEQAAAHSVQVCTLSLAFGRHLGLETEVLSELGLGALLHDIGESRLPAELLARRGQLTPEEHRLLRAHAEYGAAILRDTPRMPRSAVDVAAAHHERSDGEGYPQGLQGEAIPPFARIVAIVDMYEKLTGSEQPMRRLTAADALKSMYEWRGRLFDGPLVERFIECLGIYPVGSVVELETGEVGIVMATHPEQRLAPKLLIVRGHNKLPCEPPRVLDLALHAAEGMRRRIVQVHDAARFAIDVRSYVLRELPLAQAFTN